MLAFFAIFLLFVPVLLAVFLFLSIFLAFFLLLALIPVLLFFSVGCLLSTVAFFLAIQFLTFNAVSIFVVITLSLAFFLFFNYFLRWSIVLARRNVLSLLWVVELIKCTLKHHINKHCYLTVFKARNFMHKNDETVLPDEKVVQ